MAKRIYIYQTQTFFVEDGQEVGCGVGCGDITTFAKFIDVKMHAESCFDLIAEQGKAKYSGSIKEPNKHLDNEDLGGFSLDYEGNGTYYRFVCHVYKKTLC